MAVQADQSRVAQLVLSAAGASRFSSPSLENHFCPNPPTFIPNPHNSTVIPIDSRNGSRRLLL